MLMHQDRPLTEPLITPENQDFFAATAVGKFLLRRCHSCNKPHYYPRNICPLCGSDQTEWFEAGTSTGTGDAKLVTGEIYSYSVLRKGVEIPYCIAYVALPEGVTVLSNIVDCDFDTVRIGQKVKLCFKPAAKGTMLAMFTPA
jgi:uncharacterized protein